MEAEVSGLHTTNQKLVRRIRHFEEDTCTHKQAHTNGEDNEDKTEARHDNQPKSIGSSKNGNGDGKTAAMVKEAQVRRHALRIGKQFRSTFALFLPAGYNKVRDILDIDRSQHYSSKKKFANDTALSSLKLACELVAIPRPEDLDTVLTQVTTVRTYRSE